MGIEKKNRFIDHSQTLDHIYKNIDNAIIIKE